ncbi:hypothetical protein CBER1_01578 [Cercospora berteroae]|uniref:Uncharacterized protein n=1 Tax=Cercospora berteroae TaxID=357750 RepID=A0A2S6C7Q7_9PEZI|nr:hypothetical protein CBER1_01578 [Cercospora berteroae]
MSQNDPLLALPMGPVRNAGIVVGVSGPSAAAPDREWVTPGEKSQFSLAEDESVGQPTSLKESPSTQDDVEPTKSTVMRTATSQLSQGSITVTAAHPNVTMIGVLAVLQGLSDVVMPGSEPIEEPESDDVNKLARNPTSAGEASPVIAAGTTREVSESGSPGNRSGFVEPNSNERPASPQLQDADDQASRPQQRDSELCAAPEIGSKPQQWPESRVDDDDNAIVREKREQENTETGGHESRSERDVDLRPEQNTASDEDSPATKSSYIPDDVPRSSSKAAITDSSTLDSSVRNGSIHDRHDVTSARNPAEAPRPADQDDSVTSIEPANLIETLSFDERRRESTAGLWASSSDPHVVLPNATAMTGRSMSTSMLPDATEAREDLETVVEAVARQRSERTLSNPFPLPSPPAMQASEAPDIGGEGRRSFEAAL